MLFERTEPICFEEKELTFDLPEAQGEADELARKYYDAVRKLAIGALQDRRYRLPERMMVLDGMMRLLNEALRNKEEWIISGALEVCASMTPPAVHRNEIWEMTIMYRMMRMFSQNVSVKEIINRCLDKLELSAREEPDERVIAEAAARYQAARGMFESKYPDWEIRFEQMMVNHAFFDEYPFSDRRENLRQAHVSLCAAYALVRCLAVLWMEDKAEETALVDVCAAVFRLIEHSSFGWNVISLLETGGFGTAEDVAQLALV